MEWEDDEGSSNKSQWNEQQSYSELLFKITTMCRTCQIEQNLFGWKTALESKMSLANGIINNEEKETLVELRKQLNTVTSNAMKLEEKKRMINKNFPRLKTQAVNYSDLAKLLFETESKVDTLINTYIPFLNIKTHADISGL